MKTLLAATAAALLLTAGATPGIAYAQGKAEAKVEQKAVIKGEIKGEKGKSVEAKDNGNALAKGQVAEKGKSAETHGKSEAKGQIAEKPKAKVDTKVDVKAKAETNGKK